MSSSIPSLYSVWYYLLMVKKKLTKKVSRSISATPTHFMIKRGLIGYAIIVFVLFATLSMSIYTVNRVVTGYENSNRYNRIEAIYNSLTLGDTYRVAKSDVFGDKRVYEWDSSRTYSSSVEYGHNDTVKNTFADLTKKIEAAGFTKFETAYEGSTAEQYHFKNADGEYIRVSVVSSTEHSMVLYGTPSLEEWLKVEDKYAAPSYVTIKVNLDDNNE